MMLGKLQKAHPTLRSHFAPAYSVGSNMLRAYLLFIYGLNPQPLLVYTFHKNDNFSLKTLIWKVLFVHYYKGLKEVNDDYVDKCLFSLNST